MTLHLKWLWASCSSSSTLPGTDVLCFGCNMVFFQSSHGFKAHWECFRSKRFAFCYHGYVVNTFFLCLFWCDIWSVFCTRCLILKIYQIFYAVPVYDFLSGSIDSVQLKGASVKNRRVESRFWDASDMRRSPGGLTINVHNGSARLRQWHRSLNA